MDGKFITEKQAADLIGKSFKNLEVVIPDYIPKRVYTTGIIKVKPEENTGLVLGDVESTDLTLVATAYNIRNTTVHYRLTSTFWKYVESLGIPLSNIIDINSCCFGIDCNGTMVYVTGHKTSEFSYAIQTGEDLEIICDSFTTNRELKASTINDSTLYIQFLMQKGMNSTTSPFSFEKVYVLPEKGEPNVIYLISNGGSGDNIYDEYFWNEDESRFELFGSVKTEDDEDQPITNNTIDSLF